MPVRTTTARSLLSEPRHVVACLRLLVFGGLAVLGLSNPPVHPALFWTVTIIYGVTVLGYLVARNRDFDRRRVRCAIFLFDALVVSALIILRGRDVQGLVMAYFTLVFLAALLAGVGRPLMNAAIVAVLYHLVSLRTLAPDAVFTFERMGQLAFFFVIAAFMGYVARDVGAAQPATDGEQAGGHVVLRESTVRLRDARERLDADERLRTLDMLSKGIAHELRSPIAAIRSSVHDGPALLAELERTLRAGGTPTEVLAELRAVFQDSEHAVGQLRQVAVGLNDLGCGGGGGISDLQPDEALERAARLLRGGVDQDVSIEIDCSARRAVRVHAARVLQVLVNLASNGLDAMRGRSGSVLRLCAEDVGADRVAFTVVDAGRGIAPEVRERMYDPFYTTKAPGRGTGLGLYVAREIVRAQAGVIDCDSSEGKGTTFRVELRAAPNESAA